MKRSTSLLVTDRAKWMWHGWQCHCRRKWNCFFIPLIWNFHTFRVIGSVLHGRLLAREKLTLLNLYRLQMYIRYLNLIPYKDRTFEYIPYTNTRVPHVSCSFHCAVTALLRKRLIFNTRPRIYNLICAYTPNYLNALRLITAELSSTTRSFAYVYIIPRF